MPELVAVSKVENIENVKTYINEQFEKGKYAEITQAIGMYSILMDPERAIRDQDHLYHLVLNLLKKKISREAPRSYSSWVRAFPALLEQLVQQGEVTDESARVTLMSRMGAFGRFSSLDEFYFWALDDRRLTLDQVVRHVMRTFELHRSQSGS